MLSVKFRGGTEDALSAKFARHQPQREVQGHQAPIASRSAASAGAPSSASNRRHICVRLGFETCIRRHLHLGLLYGLGARVAEKSAAYEAELKAKGLDRDGRGGLRGNLEAYCTVTRAPTLTRSYRSTTSSLLMRTHPDETA